VITTTYLQIDGRDQQQPKSNPIPTILNLRLRSNAFESVFPGLIPIARARSDGGGASSPPDHPAQRRARPARRRPWPECQQCSLVPDPLVSRMQNEIGKVANLGHVFSPRFRSSPGPPTTLCGFAMAASNSRRHSRGFRPASRPHRLGYPRLHPVPHTSQIDGPPRMSKSRRSLTALHSDDVFLATSRYYLWRRRRVEKEARSDAILYSGWSSQRRFCGARAGPPMSRPRSNREVVGDPARFGPTGRREGHRAREGLSKWPVGPTCQRDNARWERGLGPRVCREMDGPDRRLGPAPFSNSYFLFLFIFCSFSFQFYFQIKFQFHFKLEMCSQFIFTLNVQFEHSM
jgi:hypothetical protein